MPDRAMRDELRLTGDQLDQPVDIESALHLASTNVPVVLPGQTAGEVLSFLRHRAWEASAEIAVCEHEQLRGLVRIEDLLSAADGQLVRDLMDSDPPTVSPGTTQEQAAWKAALHGERSLAVIDEAGRFRGIVPPHRLLTVLLREHDEDVARTSGFLQDTLAARTATGEPVMRRFVHRLPWLLLGVLGSLIAADIVGAFQAPLEENLVLAFFVPGIVYLADAVGTQTEAVIIRGLSLGVSVRQVAIRELVTGVLIGACLGLALFPLALLRWQDLDVALTVGISLFLACSFANAIALLLPGVLHKLNVDPAFGSGPVATVIQDLLSIVVYFAVASVIVS